MGLQWICLIPSRSVIAVMMNYDELWWIMMTDDEWWLMMNDDWWWLMTDDEWWMDEWMDEWWWIYHFQNEFFPITFSSQLRKHFMQVRVKQNLTINADLFTQFKEELKRNEPDQSKVPFCLPPKRRSIIKNPRVQSFALKHTMSTNQPSVNKQHQQRQEFSHVKTSVESSGSAVFSYSKVTKPKSQHGGTYHFSHNQRNRHL